MLTPTTLAILGLSVLGTSFLSGVFGMAGGMILLGVCLAVLDVAPAMMLHAATQFASNAWRAVLWRDNVIWPILWRYIAATMATFIVMRFIAFIPDKAMIYILLGLTPFISEILPKRWTPDIERPGAPYVCGVLAGLMQIFAGVGGTVVDVFFQKSSLDRRQIIATKAATQAVGHVFRVIYFGSFAGAMAVSLPIWMFAAAIGLAMVGTTLAARILEAMSDANFRRYSRYIIQAIGAVLMARGVWLLSAG